MLATQQSHDRRMGVALLLFTVLAGALGVAKARRYPFNARALSAESPPSPPLPRWVHIDYEWLMAPRRLTRRTHWTRRVIDYMTGRLGRVAA